MDAQLREEIARAQAAGARVTITKTTVHIDFGDPASQLPGGDNGIGNHGQET